MCENFTSVDQHLRVLIDLDSVVGQILHDTLGLGAMRSVASRNTAVAIFWHINAISKFAAARGHRTHCRRIFGYVLFRRLALHIV